MHFHISRNGQTYGPYTLEDLQRYVSTGNVLLTDMAKSEEMADWIPVSQLLTPPAAPVDVPPADPSAPAFSTPSYADPGSSTSGYAGTAPMYGQPVAQTYPPQGLAASPYPDAPNLHWGLYLLFSVLTCGLFSVVFTCVQAAWLKKVQPNSNGLIFYIATYVIYVIRAVRSRAATLSMFALMNHHHGFTAAPGAAFAVPLFFLYWALLFTTRFVMRNSLQEHFNTVEPIGLNLNPVMTFFFGGVYFQAELNRINAMKQAARFGAGRAF